MDPVGDVSHATSALADFGRRHWAAKSAHDVEGFLGTFSATSLVYGDATLGLLRETPQEFRETIEAFMPAWGAGVSYSLRLLGDERSAVALVRDSPEMFGGEIFLLGAGDWDDDGRLVRWIDYWDSRNFGVETAARLRAPAERFPSGFGEDRVPSRATTAMTGVVDRLVAALGGEHPERAAELFATTATLEDMTARTRVRGAAAIGRYLGRAAPVLPWARGARACHVLGNELGGGYEWTNPQHAVPRGISAIELDPDGRISDLVAVWDGALVEPAELARVAALALED